MSEGVGDTWLDVADERVAPPEQQLARIAEHDGNFHLAVLARPC